MTGIMRGEWGNNGMSITDNILVYYCNGADAVMAGGVTTCDAMLPYVTNLLPEYENDPVIVTAMREACHHNLYALANSSGMNGVGANTTITVTQPMVITICMIIACGACFFMLLGIVMWIIGGCKLRKTEAYKTWKAMKKAKKAVKA